MEHQPITIKNLLSFIRERAARIQIAEIVEAHIVVTPADSKFLDMKPDRGLEVIQY